MPSFTLPEGVEIPENLKEGEAFQTMATIVLGKNGKAEFTEIDGMAIPGYEKLRVSPVCPGRFSTAFPQVPSENHWYRQPLFHRLSTGN